MSLALFKTQGTSLFRDPFFDDFWGLGAHSLLSDRFGAGFDGPKAEFAETDGDFILSLEIPGYDRKNIEILAEGDALTVRGAREDSWRRGGEGRSYQSFERSFHLPGVGAADNVRANMKNGILEIRAPKPLAGPPATGRTIPIMNGAPDARPALSEAAAEEGAAVSSRAKSFFRRLADKIRRRPAA